ncbi:hypothetical protein BXZ70DRAFT_50167 [Cristinia sonorae]|uniref:Uncharacterized protein n=1 Tax=Cristinia sonorae TaxID=1940300 RepID=A0A8K0XR74_9AGAR|nr:hypothetical protein BXZ70DRAFT_50167 [Cristinia sonorae]
MVIPPLPPRNLIMSSPSALQTGLSALTATCAAIASNGTTIDILKTKLDQDTTLSPTLLNAVDEVVGACNTWISALAVVRGRVSGVVGLVIEFVACLPAVVNVTSEVERTEPLWGFISDMNNTSLTPTKDLVAWQQAVLSATSTFSATLSAEKANSGPLNGLLVGLNAYTVLIPQLIRSLQFLDLYQSDLAEESAGVMMWAAKDSLETNRDMPFLLKNFKYTGTTKFDRDVVALSVFINTDWASQI